MSIILSLLTSKLFALLGGGGLGFGARILGFDRKAVAFAKTMPRWVWITMAVIVALVAGYFVHGHRVHKYKADVQRAQMAADNDDWKRKLSEAHADATAWKQAAEAAQTKISNQERLRHEETVRNNAAVARTLLVRGPGAAGTHCGPLDRAGPGAGAGGHEPTFTPDETPGPPMPAGDWATVPWQWLVEVVTEHDDSISENSAWRGNDARQRTARDQLITKTKP